MNADKDKAATPVILNVSEESYTPAHNYHKKQDPSTSLRYGHDDRNRTVICVYLRSSVDKIIVVF